MFLPKKARLFGGALALSGVVLVAGASSASARPAPQSGSCIDVHVYNNSDPGGMWIQNNCSSTKRVKIIYDNWPDKCYTVESNSLVTGIPVRPGVGTYAGWTGC